MMIKSGNEHGNACMLGESVKEKEAPQLIEVAPAIFHNVKVLKIGMPGVPGVTVQNATTISLVIHNPLNHALAPANS